MAVKGGCPLPSRTMAVLESRRAGCGTTADSVAAPPVAGCDEEEQHKDDQEHHGPAGRGTEHATIHTSFTSLSGAIKMQQCAKNCGRLTQGRENVRWLVQWSA